jgi:hypothetical protein
MKIIIPKALFQNDLFSKTSTSMKTNYIKRWLSSRSTTFMKQEIGILACYKHKNHETTSINEKSR